MPGARICRHLGRPVAGGMAASGSQLPVGVEGPRLGSTGERSREPAARGCAKPGPRRQPIVGRRRRGRVSRGRRDRSRRRPARPPISARDLHQRGRQLAYPRRSGADGRALLLWLDVPLWQPRPRNRGDPRSTSLADPELCAAASAGCAIRSPRPRPDGWSDRLPVAALPPAPAPPPPAICLRGVADGRRRGCARGVARTARRRRLLRPHSLLCHCLPNRGRTLARRTPPRGSPRDHRQAGMRGAL